MRRQWFFDFVGPLLLLLWVTMAASLPPLSAAVVKHRSKSLSKKHGIIVFEQNFISDIGLRPPRSLNIFVSAEYQGYTTLPESIDLFIRPIHSFFFIRNSL